MDAFGVLSRVFDGTGLSCTVVVGTPDPAWPLSASRLDEAAVWSKVYDETTGTVRVVLI